MNNLFIQSISIDWDEISEDSYLRRIEVLKNMQSLQLCKPITIFTGENGSGKSTLLEAIAVAYGFNPEGGTKNYSFSTYDSHSELHEAIRLVRGYRRAWSGYFLRAESFYNVATKEEEYADISREYHKKSHGESFLALAQDQMRGDGVFILDEPMVGLDPYTANQVKNFFREHSNKGNLVLFSSHNLDVVEKLCDRVYIIDQGALIAEIDMNEFKRGGNDLESYFLAITNRVAKNEK